MTLLATENRMLIEGLRGRESRERYRQRGGYSSLQASPDSLLREVEASGLRGRGGGAFPTGRKWRAVAGQPGPRSVLVNGAESEPASQKDSWLLTYRPHLVLDGALLAARAVGADLCVFYVHEDNHSARESLKAALSGLNQAGIRFPKWRIVTAPAGYVAGEESAAIQRINGKAAKPTFKPPMAFQRGIGGRPTLVNNVETLANIPSIVRDGAVAFRRVGTNSWPGTMLVTLSGAVERPGIYEIPHGTSITEIVDFFGGGVRNGLIQAVLPGGYFGGWIGPDALRQGVTLDGESLALYGANLGSGAIVVVPDSVCGILQAAALSRFFADESVRQCDPAPTAPMPWLLPSNVRNMHRPPDRTSNVPGAMQR
jgi:NADH:ubiquinone oxidoreductase subunit F (NADH-binding)